MPAQVGAVAPTDAGDPRDMLAVYTADNGIDAAPLWRDSVTGGLNAPQMELVRDFRAAVDKTAKTP